MKIKSTVFCVSLIVLIFSFFSCKSTPEVSVNSEVPKVEPISTTLPTTSTENTETQGIQLAVPVIPPKPENLGNFPDISSATLKLIEEGTLTSLYVDGTAAETAVKGDEITFPFPVTVRKNDAFFILTER